MKHIVIVFLCLSFAFRAFSQKAKFQAGIVTGPNYSTLYGNYIVNKYAIAKLGYTGGLAFQYNFNRRFTLTSNVCFERKGTMNKFENEIINEDSIKAKLKSSSYFHADYITLPIFARLNFGKKHIFFINAGPYCSYLLAWKERHHFSTPEIKDPQFNTTHYYNYTENFKRFDFGISAGLGFQLPIEANYTLTLEARNNLGLANISALPVIYDQSIKNFSGNFLVGLNYYFK